MSGLLAIEASVLDIPFKVAFRHASASREAMQSLWVRVLTAGGEEGVGEGCPRQYVTGESLDTAQAFVDAHRDPWRRSVSDVESMQAWVAAHRAQIDRNPAAWSAVELAMLDAWACEAGSPIEAIADLPVTRGRYRYTAVLGDGPAEAFAAMLARYRQAGFEHFKVKLSGDVMRDRAKVDALRSAGIRANRVRADANNLWCDPEQAASHLASLDFPFWALEEPLAAGDFTGMRSLSDLARARIILDESLLTEAQLEPLAADASRWIVNVRVSKMGGLFRAAAVIRRARVLGTAIVIGAHVGESSVLTRAALALAPLAGDALLGQEGAFGTWLLERDPVSPSLMFGPGGSLDFDPAAFGPGLGVTPGTDPNLG